MARLGHLRGGVARAVLGEEPKRDARPWVRGCEPELASYDQDVSRASVRKRQAESAAETWEEWTASVAEVRRCKRRRLAWLRSKEVEWWDNKAKQAQDKADQGDSFGVFAAFKELRLRGSSLSSGEVRPVDAQAVFRKIGEGPGEVVDRVWANVPSYPPWMLFGDTPPPPTNCMRLLGR